jgi:CRP/FNR family transcriptional regulator, cyclic AMP receptor protein
MPEKAAQKPATQKPDEKSLTRRIATLKAMTLFGRLNEKELTTVVEDLRVKEYDKDDIIFRQGDESRELYGVLRGKVRIYKISPAGDETSIAIFSTNDVIGELAALDNLPRSATAKAVTATTLLAISQERFLHHLSNMSKLGIGLAHLLADKLRWTAEFAESVAQYDAAGRLLHILLLHNERYGESIQGDKVYRVEIGLNQSDLASMVGARREWINRILSDWRRRGLLEFDSGVITILDLPRVIAERDSRLEANQNAAGW